MICKACGEECYLVEVDFGIGFGEYWGAPFCDVQLATVTACCEADWWDWDVPTEAPEEYITEMDMEVMR